MPRRAHKTQRRVRDLVFVRPVVWVVFVAVVLQAALETLAAIVQGALGAAAVWAVGSVALWLAARLGDTLKLFPEA